MVQTDLQKRRNELGSARRRNDPEATARARQNLAEAHIEAAIERALATAPPLRDEQRERLVALLKPIEAQPKRRTRRPETVAPQADNGAA
jgi:hypothetical protein